MIERPAKDDADKELLVRLRAGDQQAFDELVARYHVTLVRVARMYVSSDAVAEEVAQEAWLGLLDGLDRFQQRSSLKTWLFTILTNRAMTRGQRESRSVPFSALAQPQDDAAPTVDPERFGPDGGWRTPPRPFDLPEARVAALELREQLRGALGLLPERQQIVLTLHDVQGMSTVQVGEVLGLSAGNARVLLHRARAKLQGTLAEYLGGSPPPGADSARNEPDVRETES
jgi:RNA polymerase sigma-70 factor, ECF subfamily